MIMSKHEEYATKAINARHSSDNAGVIYALLALGERMAEFTEWAKEDAARDDANGDLFIGYPDDPTRNE
jgi:hypothetical protein